MSAYTDRVDRNLAGLNFISVGLCPTCPECQAAFGVAPQEFYAAYGRGNVFDEGGFSWSGCGICDSTDGQTLYSWHARDEGDRLIHGDDMCADCVCFIANGDEPERE